MLKPLSSLNSSTGLMIWMGGSGSMWRGETRDFLPRPMLGLVACSVYWLNSDWPLGAPLKQQDMCCDLDSGRKSTTIDVISLFSESMIKKVRKRN